MKKQIALLVLFVAFSTTAQKIQQNVGDFTKLKVYDLIQVQLIKSDVNKISISGENSEDVEVINKNGTLKLRMKLEERFDGNRTYIKLFYTGLDIIDANEGSEISSEETIEQNTIELKSQEGGRIVLKLEVNHLKVRGITGGEVSVSGKAVSQDIDLGTGGMYYGKNFETQATEVSITAAGEAEIHAVEKATIKVTAGGDVTVYGNPEKITKRTVAGGRISVVN